MHTTIKTLDNETFQQIYTNKKFRNEVAFSHAVCDKNSNPQYKKTCSYPVSWKVTEEQIELAKAERERSIQETIKANKGKLLFVGMGAVRELGKGITNHRFRAKFENLKGQVCFVEFSYIDNKVVHGCLHIDYAIFNYDMKEETYIARNKGFFLDPSEEAVINYVNKTFGCNFKEIFIDNYDCSPDDVVSKV